MRRSGKDGMARIREFALSLFIAVSTVAAMPVQILLDTDFRTDVDDPGTLAMLHGLQNEGRVQLVGLISSTAGSSVVGAIDAVNTYFRRPDLPIGLIAAVRASGGSDPYAPTLANSDLYPSDQTNASAPRLAIRTASSVRSSMKCASAASPAPPTHFSLGLSPPLPPPL